MLGEVRLLAPGNQPRPADMKSILVLINNEDFNWDNPGLNKTFSRENSRNKPSFRSIFVLTPNIKSFKRLNFPEQSSLSGLSLC